MPLEKDYVARHVAFVDGHTSAGAFGNAPLDIDEFGNVSIINPLTAAVNDQKFSPQLRLTGSGWKTGGTAAAQASDWILENQPVQAGDHVGSLLRLAYQFNGGGYLNRFSVEEMPDQEAARVRITSPGGAVFLNFDVTPDNTLGQIYTTGGEMRISTLGAIPMNFYANNALAGTINVDGTWDIGSQSGAIASPSAAISLGSYYVSGTGNPVTHIDLYGGGYGLGVSFGQLNFASQGSFNFWPSSQTLAGIAAVAIGTDGLKATVSVHSTANANWVSSNAMTIGAAAKATGGTGGRGMLQIYSDNSSDRLEGSVEMITHATAANRRLKIQIVEQNVAFRNVSLAEDGGNVGIAKSVPTSKLHIGSGDLTLDAGGIIMTGNLASSAGGISLTAANAGVELGSTGSTNTPFIDFHSSANANDYDARLIASGGGAGNGLGGLQVVGILDVTGAFSVGGSFALTGNQFTGGFYQGPVVQGGAAASSSLILQSTSGTGTSDLISMRTGSQLERIRVDTNGCVIINKTGTAFAAPNSTHPLAMIGSNTDCVMGYWAWGAANAPGTISMNYTRSTTNHVTHSAVNSGDWLGLWGSNGSDGTNFLEGARIIMAADANFTTGSSPGRILLCTVPSGSSTFLERLRIDKDGRVNIGNQAAVVGTFMLQISDTSATGALSIITNGGAFSGSTFISFDKSRSSSPSGITAVVSGDTLGYMQFRGTNGTDIQQAAYVLGASDGTPSSSSMPGRLVFATTPSGSNGSTERMRISNGGNTYLIGATAQTTASAANAFINNASTPAGEILRSTSSLRYKKDLEPIDDVHLAAVLAINPFWYRSKASRDNPEWSFYGMAAEEVAAVDPRLCQWGYLEEDYDEVVREHENGEIFRERVLKKDAILVPDGVMYDRVAILQIAALSAQITSLKSQVANLESRMGGIN